jgi:hypothetical protein
MSHVAVVDVYMASSYWAELGRNSPTKSLVAHHRCLDQTEDPETVIRRWLHQSAVLP